MLNEKLTISFKYSHNVKIYGKQLHVLNLGPNRPGERQKMQLKIKSQSSTPSQSLTHNKSLTLHESLQKLNPLHKLNH